jgi:hypothetical protein
MYCLNKNARAIFMALVSKLEEEKKAHVKIDNTNGAFMPVSFERLDTFDFCNRKTTSYSIAHYYKQNGDLVPDPDMVFFFVHDTNQIFPAYFQDYRSFKECLYFDGVWKFNPIEQKDQAKFANIWLNNIKEQQGF